MNLKKVIRQHERIMSHPVAYFGVTEDAEHHTTVVLQSDKDHPLNREDVIVLLADLARFAWRVTNGVREAAGAPKVNMADFLNEVYVAGTHLSHDEMIVHDETPKGGPV